MGRESGCVHARMPPNPGQYRACCHPRVASPNSNIVLCMISTKRGATMAWGAGPRQKGAITNRTCTHPTPGADATAHLGVRVRSKQEDRTESDISVCAAGKYALNFSFCRTHLKSSSKVAGAAPATFELLFRCMRQKLEFSAYFPARKTPSDPAEASRDPGCMRRSLPPSVLRCLPSH